MVRLLSLLLTLVTLSAVPCTPSARPFYVSAMEVISASYEQKDDGDWEQMLTFETATGFIYEASVLGGDFFEGDIALCLMYNNGTNDTIEDDILLKAEYSGFSF